MRMNFTSLPLSNIKIWLFLVFQLFQFQKAIAVEKKHPEHVTICFQVHRWLLPAHLVKWERRLLTLHVFTSISPCPVAIVGPLIPKRDDT